MNQVNIDNLSEYLFNQSVRSGMMITLENAENLFAHRVEELGVTEEERKVITECVMIPHEHHCIKARPMMLALGLIAEGQRGDKIKRALNNKDAKLIPDQLDLSTAIDEDAYLALTQTWGNGNSVSSGISESSDPNVQLVPLGTSETDNLTLPQSRGSSALTTNTENSILWTQEQMKPNEQILYYNESCLIYGTPGKKTTKQTYVLTRDAMYIALVSAYQTRKYAKYFSLKWQISEQYKLYQSKYTKYVEIQDKNRTIGSLERRLDQMALDNQNQSRKLDKLMIYAEDTNEKLTNTKEQLDILFDTMIHITKMTLPMWIGSSVFKTQFENLITDKTLDYALKHLKVMFVVGFYEHLDQALQTQTINGVDIEVQTNVKIYFCCTNFGDVGKRLRELSIRHKDMHMLKPQAICMISCEVNSERVQLERMRVFPDNASFNYLQKQKSFDVGLSTRNPSEVSNAYESIVQGARNCRFQAYQSRMDATINNVKINKEIISRIQSADTTFFGSVLPLCQEYIDCHVKKEDEFSYSYGTASRKGIQRADFQNMKMSNSMYALMKISSMIKADSGSTVVEDMLKSGTISKKDIKALKKVAEVENVDVSAIDLPDSSSDDEE